MLRFSGVGIRTRRLYFVNLFLLVRSPALRSPRSGTPRRHLITPIPGTGAVSSSHPFLSSFLSLSVWLMDSLSPQSNIKVFSVSFSCLVKLKHLHIMSWSWYSLHTYPRPNRHKNTLTHKLAHTHALQVQDISGFLCLCWSLGLYYISLAYRKNWDIFGWPVWQFNNAKMLWAFSTFKSHWNNTVSF